MTASGRGCNASTCEVALVVYIQFSEESRNDPSKNFPTLEKQSLKLENPKCSKIKVGGNFQLLHNLYLKFSPKPKISLEKCLASSPPYETPGEG